MEQFYIGSARTKEFDPLSRDELEEKLDIIVQNNARQWGKDHIYTKWAEQSKKDKLARFDGGEAVRFQIKAYHKDGMDWEKRYFSDGTTDNVCLGYND
jgi:hypothetical protein